MTVCLRRNASKALKVFIFVYLPKILNSQFSILNSLSPDKLSRPQFPIPLSLNTLPTTFSPTPRQPTPKLKKKFPHSKPPYRSNYTDEEGGIACHPLPTTGTTTPPTHHHTTPPPPALHHPRNGTTRQRYKDSLLYQYQTPTK